MIHQKISNWPEMVLYLKFFRNFAYFLCFDPKTKKSKFSGASNQNLKLTYYNITL